MREAALRKLMRFAIPACAVLCAASTAAAVELSGAIRSSTGALPPGIELTTVRKSDMAAIAGKVENGRYRIALPDSGRFVLHLKAPGWKAAPKMIFDPKHAGALDFLVYPAKLPEPELAAELIEMGRQDQAIRNEIKPGPLDKALFGRMAEEDLVRERRLAAVIEAKGRSLALSIDRDLMHDGKPQIYGSQLRSGADGKPALYPIEDPGHVDERRAAMGMEPLAQYLKRFEE